MAKILLIEDEAPVREMLLDELTVQGHKVIEAANGEEGLQKFLENEPDLVLCDRAMPGMSGFDVLERIPRRASAIHRRAVHFPDRADRCPRQGRRRPSQPRRLYRKAGGFRDAVVADRNAPQARGLTVTPASPSRAARLRRLIPLSRYGTCRGHRCAPHAGRRKAPRSRCGRLRL